MALDQQKLDAFLGKFVGDLGATLHAGTVVLGEQLGLYKALAEKPVTSSELAEKTSTSERYVREWLAAQAAAGYAMYDPKTSRYSLSEEQAFALATEGSPAYIPGAFQLALGALKSVPKIAQVFRSGLGFGWHQHHPWLFEGTEKFFRPGYAANLIGSWIPALEGVEAKLKKGARVADVGCGHGASTILMAQAYPNTTFTGFDYHGPSIEWARKSAQAAGVADRVAFEAAPAKGYQGHGYDLVAMFDCLHDMGDPAGASAHVLQSLGPDGTWMIVEPFANDHIEDNLNPVGRVFYSASTLICTPCSKAQEVGRALGAQAGEAVLREVVTSAGFSRFRRATQTPFNLILEARP
jgi:2-polyprenyl-3-methyl-5-hydroxy-6-metoxy-1,4-benzoquinol methylase